MWEQIEQLGISRQTALYSAAGLVAAIAVLMVVSRLFRRKPAPKLKQQDLTLRIEDLVPGGPAGDGPVLELLNVPVRIAAIIVAPVGRATAAPSNGEVLKILDDIVPKLGAVAKRHQPRIVHWPFQISAQGFANNFFTNVRLPGNKGKGSPWCSMSGRCESDDHKYMIGLVFCADAQNGLGQLIVERDSQWLDMLRVKG